VEADTVRADEVSGAALSEDEKRLRMIELEGVVGLLQPLIEQDGGVARGWAPVSHSTHFWHRYAERRLGGLTGLGPGRSR
jgi:hypothetical protein